MLVPDQFGREHAIWYVAIPNQLKKSSELLTIIQIERTVVKEERRERVVADPLFRHSKRVAAE